MLICVKRRFSPVENAHAHYTFTSSILSSQEDAQVMQVDTLYPLTRLKYCYVGALLEVRRDKHYTLVEFCI